MAFWRHGLRITFGVPMYDAERLDRIVALGEGVVQAAGRAWPRPAAVVRGWLHPGGFWITIPPTAGIGPISW